MAYLIEYVSNTEEIRTDFEKKVRRFEEKLRERFGTHQK